MLTPSRPASTVDAAASRSATRCRRLPVRVDPGRDLVARERARTRSTCTSTTRRARCRSRTTPTRADRGELAERLRQRAGEPARCSNRRHGRRAQGRVRDHERAELPALLLELPRDEGERLRPADPLHERGGDRLGQARGEGLCPATIGADRRAADRRRRRARRPTDGKTQADLRHGPAQPREQRRGPRLRPSGRALGRRHVRERPGAVAGATRYIAHERERRAGTTRATCGRSSPTRPAINDYDDFAPGSNRRSQGHFVKVPKNIATGRNPDGTEMMAADVGYPRRRRTTGWQTVRHGVGIDGPQWVLEHWSDLNNVFQFVADRGHGLRQAARDAERRLHRRLRPRHAPDAVRTPGRSTNGRIWKMVLDQNDPTKVTSLTILDRGRHQPGQDARRDPPAGQPRVDRRTGS